MCYMSVVYRGGEAQCRAWSPNRHSCFPSAFICFTCGQRAFLLAIAYTNRIKYILIWRCRNCGKVNVLKLLASSYLSVSLPAGNILFPTGRIFMKMILFLKNLSKKFKFLYNLTGTTGTLHEDQYTIFIISRSVLRMRNVADGNCRENQNTYFSFNKVFFFSKIVSFMRICGKIP